MRPWAGLKRLLALVVTVIFAVGVLATPVFAKSRSFSGGRSSSFGSGSRSFSSPKTSTPSAPSRSFSTPKSPTTTPSTPSTRSFSSPSTPGYSSSSKNYSTPNSQNYSSGSRNYSSESRSYSSQRSAAPAPGTATSTPSPSYDTGRTKYPSRPPVVVVGPSTYDPWYWHDWYYGRPWYWRVWHRPVYYGSAGWAISWVTVVAFGIGTWFMLGIISAMLAKRRR